MTDRKNILSTLWIFLTLNYLYCDLLSMMDPGLLNQYLSGSIEGIEVTQGFLFGSSVLMEIPIAMVLLSRVLNRRANRWANIAAGAVMTIVQIASLFVGTPSGYYLFFSAIEVSCAAFIVWYAWNWPRPSVA